MARALRAWFPALVSVFVLIGCLMLFAEMMIGGHNRGEARIGIIFAILGMAVSAASAAIVVFRIRVGNVIRGVVVAAWLALAVGGLIGTWDHVRGEGEDDGRIGRPEAALTTTRSTWQPAASEREEGGRESDDKRPPMAPLAFTGLGLLGALAFVLGTERAPA
jgi:hypothetical protein